MHREIIINLNVHWSTRYLKMTAVRFFFLLWGFMNSYTPEFCWGIVTLDFPSVLDICRDISVELNLHEMRTLIKIRTNTGINNWKTYKYMNIVAYNLNVSQLSFCWLQKSLFINYSHCSFSMCIQYMYSVLFLKRALF